MDLISQTDKSDNHVTEYQQKQKSFDFRKQQQNIKTEFYGLTFKLNQKVNSALHLFNTRGTLVKTGGQRTKPNYSEKRLRNVKTLFITQYSFNGGISILFTTQAQHLCVCSGKGISDVTPWGVGGDELLWPAVKRTFLFFNLRSWW